MIYVNPRPGTFPGSHPRWCCCDACCCPECQAEVGREHERGCRRFDPEGAADLLGKARAMQYPEADQSRPHPCPWKQCGAALYWVKLESGRWIKVNATPDTSQGRYVITYHKRDNEMHGSLYDPASHPNRNRYRDHLDTCPATLEWRAQKALEQLAKEENHG